MAYQLGVDLSFAVKRWPEPEQWIEIVRKTLGIRHLEFDSDFLDPLYLRESTWRPEAERIRMLAANADLEIHNYFTGEMTHCVNLLSHPRKEFREDGMLWCEKGLEVTTALGCRGMGGHFDTISSADIANPARYQARIESLLASAKHLARLAKKEGHEFLLWEQIYSPSEVPYTLVQTRDFLARVNADNEDAVPIELVVDLGHACCQNFPHSEADTDPYAWLREFAPQTRVVHLQQCDGHGSSHWPFTKEYNERGIVEPRRVLDALGEGGAGEDLLLCFEIFFSLSQNDQQVLDAMKRSVEYWSQFIPL